MTAPSNHYSNWNEPILPFWEDDSTLVDRVTGYLEQYHEEKTCKRCDSEFYGPGEYCQQWCEAKGDWDYHEFYMANRGDDDVDD